jgi:hypothetical protein
VVDNTTYFTYPCEIVTAAGTRTATGYLLKPQTTGWHDGKTYKAATNHKISSRKLSLANTETEYTGGALVTSEGDASRNFHVLMAAPDGTAYRSSKLGVRAGSIRTTALGTNTTILESAHFEDTRVEYVKATICYKVPANGNVGVYVVHGVVRRSSTATLDWTTVDTIVNEESLATAPNIIAKTLFGLAEGWTIRVTGKAATNIDWTCHAESIVIPTSA